MAPLDNAPTTDALSTDAGSWKDRVRPGAYTAPSGARHSFLFERVSREIELRRAVFQFPGVNGVYIQDNGTGERVYPLRCIFSGAQCDRLATAFEAALMEPGVGRLEHPLYETFDAIPMGRSKRTDDLVDGLNQSIVEVAFWPTLRAVYPSPQSEPASEIAAAIEGFDAAAAQGFADVLNLPGAAQRAGLKGAMLKALGEVRGALQSLSEPMSTVSRAFYDAESVLNAGMDTFVGTPLLLGQQFINLIGIPSRIIGGLQSRLEGYGLLIDRMTSSDAGNPGDHLDPSTLITERTYQLANAFHGADLVALSAVAGAVSACVEHSFETRPEALEAAATVVALFDAVVAWRDAAFDDISVIGIDQLDTGAAIQALGEAVALTSGMLVQASFTLLPERIVVLDRRRNIIELAAELYGSVDDRLDDLINHNHLTGDEILELPRGREIRYYPEAA